MKKYKTGKDDMAGKIALGVTGVAITAGAVAAGVALANKKNRAKLAKGIKNTVKDFNKVKKNFQDGQTYQAVAHKIGIGGRRRGMKKVSEVTSLKSRKKLKRD